MALSQNCVMVSYENKNELRPREVAELNHYCTANGIALRGKNACLQFQRFQPHYYPWYVDDEADQMHLAEALEAALAVSDSLAEMTAEEHGFTEGAPFDRTIPLLEKKGDGFEWRQIALPEPKKLTYPSPEFHDDIALMKLAKSKKRGAEWACDVLMHVDVMTDEKSEDGYVEEPKNAPFYPYLLLILDTKSEMVLTVQLADDPADYSESFARTILDAALNHGKPKRISVCNERAYALFERLSGALGAELVMEDYIPSLEDAEESLLEHFGKDGGDETEQMFEILKDPQALRNMPDELLIQAEQIIQMGILPDDIAQNLLNERKRRGL